MKFHLSNHYLYSLVKNRLKFSETYLKVLFQIREYKFKLWAPILSMINV